MLSLSERGRQEEESKSPILKSIFHSVVFSPADDTKSKSSSFCYNNDDNDDYHDTGLLRLKVLQCKIAMIQCTCVE